MSEGLPPEVVTFIATHVNSVEQVEVLLLLFRQRARAFSAEDVSAELRSSAVSARERLADLTARGILVEEAEGHYRYAPKDPELAKAATALAATYEQHRYTVINLIFSKPVDHIKTFARAFRLRKDESDG